MWLALRCEHGHSKPRSAFCRVEVVSYVPYQVLLVKNTVFNVEKGVEIAVMRDSRWVQGTV